MVTLLTFNPETQAIGSFVIKNNRYKNELLTFFRKDACIELFLNQDKNYRSIRFCKFASKKNYAEKLSIPHKI